MLGRGFRLHPQRVTSLSTSGVVTPAREGADEPPVMVTLRPAKKVASASRFNAFKGSHLGALCVGGLIASGHYRVGFWHRCASQLNNHLAGAE